MNQLEFTWKSLKNHLNYFADGIFGTFFLEIVIIFFLEDKELRDWEMKIKKEI